MSLAKYEENARDAEEAPAMSTSLPVSNQDSQSVVTEYPMDKKEGQDEGDDSPGGGSGGSGSIPDREMRGENPLLNDSVLDTLTPMIRLKERWELRRVCKPWNQKWLPSLRASTTIKIEDEPRGLAVQTGSGSILLRTFLDFVEDPENQFESHPYRQFHLESFNFSHATAQTRRFWKLVGRNITSLEFSGSTIGLDNESQFRTLFLTRCPNLEHLNLGLDASRGEAFEAVRLIKLEQPELLPLKTLSGRIDWEGIVMRISGDDWEKDIDFLPGYFPFRGSILALLMEARGGYSCSGTFSS